MSLRPVFMLGLLIILSAATLGCSSSGFGFMKKAGPMGKSEQWEPNVDAPQTDWRSDAGKLGRGNRRSEKEDPLDKLLWSDQARDINRNMGFN